MAISRYNRFLRPLTQARNDNQHSYLLHSEGLAVSALVHGGVTLVGADQNTVQGAEVCVLAVVSALLNGAFNALVCLAIHSEFLLFC